MKYNQRVTRRVERLAVFAFTWTLQITLDLIPRHWHVSIQGTPILGGIDNKIVFMSKEKIAARPEKAIKELTIRGMAIMGGIEVKNRPSMNVFPDISIADNPSSTKSKQNFFWTDTFSTSRSAVSGYGKLYHRSRKL